MNEPIPTADRPGAAAASAPATRIAGALATALATALAFALPHAAAAAPLTPPPATATAAPVPPDTMAQRLLPCTVCHGAAGRATPDGYYPRIAGKPAGYLYAQLVAFRSGRRQNEAMARLTETLTDAYLREIAAHFAALDLPYPPPVPHAVAPAVLARGRTLVAAGDASIGVPACTDCHGAAMTGVLPAVPGLLGLPRDYLLAQLGAWRTGLRTAAHPDCMRTIAQRLAPGDLEAVATWLAAQPVPADARPVAALPQPPAIACGSGPR